MSERKDKTQATIDAALEKINKIRSGSAFAGDFEAARIIESLLLELKVAQLRIDKHKKLVSYYKLYISKRLNKDE
jgi:hypothetical protein